MIVMRANVNTGKQVFCKIEKIILIFGASFRIWGYAAVCTNAGQNVYPATITPQYYPSS
jgi:hypothetical protein